MSMIRVTCSQCGNIGSLDSLKIPSGEAFVTCPRCNNKVTVNPHQPAAGFKNKIEINKNEANAETDDELGIKCLKCGYQRRKKDDNLVPDGECPKCGIVYSKYMQARIEAVEAISEDRRNPFRGYEYAGFWIRAAASLIDGLVLFVIFFLIGMIYFLVRKEVPTQNTCNSLGLLIGFSYEVVLLSSYWQATIGKRVCGLKVIDTDGNRISFARAVGRYFARFPSAIILCIGYLMVAFHQRKQGLHDIIASTLVIRV